MRKRRCSRLSAQTPGRTCGVSIDAITSGGMACAPIQSRVAGKQTIEMAVHRADMRGGVFETRPSLEVVYDEA